MSRILFGNALNEDQLKFGELSENHQTAYLVEARSIAQNSVFKNEYRKLMQELGDKILYDDQDKEISMQHRWAMGGVAFFNERMNNLAIEAQQREARANRMEKFEIEKFEIV